jgi:hypothetical protein
VLLAKVDDQGVAEQLALPARPQLPGISPRDPFGVVALHQQAIGDHPGQQLGQPAAAVGTAKRQTGIGKLSRLETCGSKLTGPSSCWQRWALTAHRLAACRTKVVRWMRPARNPHTGQLGKYV